LASWEVLPGSYTLRWQHGGVQRDLAIEVPQGRTQVVIVHGDTATAVAPPPDDLPPDSAAVAVVAAGGQAVWVDGGQGQRQTAAKWLALSAPLPSIVLGEGLAKRLQVRVGEEVRAVSPMRGLERSSEGAEGSANGRFVVTAVVRTGFHDHDQRLALVDFGAAQRFLGRGDLARWVEVRVDDPILATREVDRYMAALDDSDFESLLGGAQELDRRLHALAAEPPPGLDLRAPADSAAVVDNWGSGLRTARQLQPRSQGLYRVIDWEEMNRNIFDAARLQKVAMSLFPFIIVLVAALNVVGTQAVVVHERARDIAILRAMGARRRSVAAVFLFQGLVVGLLGMAIGLAVGGLCCWLLAAVGYPLDPQVYLIDRLPVRAEPGTFVVAGVAAAVLAFAAAWFAAQRAAARPPVDALRRLD
jgi:ABC-type lipoprotein release transport system permease subunit